MLYLYIGTDREKARTKMGADIAKVAGKSAEVLRITDAHSMDDLRAALRGGGMFGTKRVLVFENIFTNEEMGEAVLSVLPTSSEQVFVFEEKVLADLRRKLEKYAERVETFDLPKKGRDNSIFGLANALKRDDRKTLWVAYMCELAKGTAPEAIHGVLFWSVKDAFLRSGARDEHMRGRIAALAALPHEARRRGEDLEYALERFVLCV